MFKHNLAITINTQRPDKDGKMPVRIRATIQGKVSYYNTGVVVKKENWNNITRQVIRIPNAVLLNGVIRDKLNEIEKSFLEANIMGLQEMKIKSIQTYFDEYAQKMINHALKDRTISRNPLLGFERTKYKSPEIDYLTQKEISLIEKYADNPDHNPSLVNTARWFVFCCYCGLRYSDAARLDASHIKEGRIIMQTQKTGEQISIKIYPKLKEAYDKINQPLYTNQKANAYLKMIGVATNIKKKLTWHVARHSFAVMFLDKGGSMEALSKLLGHSSIKITQVYGKITNRRIDDELLRVFR